MVDEVTTYQRERTQRTSSGPSGRAADPDTKTRPPALAGDDHDFFYNPHTQIVANLVFFDCIVKL